MGSYSGNRHRKRSALRLFRRVFRVVRRWRRVGEILFDLVEPFAQRLGQTGVHVRGHGHRDGGERDEHRGHRTAAASVAGFRHDEIRERFKHDEH